MNLSAEKGWILQQGFWAHDSIYSSHLNALDDILIAVYASICINWNINRLLDFLYDFPITFANLLLILFFCSSMDSENSTTSIDNLPHQLHSGLLSRKNSDFACNRYFKIVMEFLYHFSYKVSFPKQKWSIMAFSSYSLWTSQININSIAAIFNFLGCLK